MVLREGKVGTFGAASVAAEIAGWVDEGADVAGPGVVLRRSRGEINHRSGFCQFRNSRRRW